MQLETKQGQTKQLGMKSCWWEPRGSMKQEASQGPGARSQDHIRSPELCHGAKQKPTGAERQPSSPQGQPRAWGPTAALLPGTRSMCSRGPHFSVSQSYLEREEQGHRWRASSVERCKLEGCSRAETSGVVP